MKRFLFFPLALALLCASCWGQCSSPCYIDALYTGSGSNGTSTNPFSSITSAWSQINTNLASGAVTVYFSALVPAGNAPETSSAEIDLTQRSNTSTNILTLDGVSKYQTNSNHGTGQGTWAANLTPAPCTSWRCAANANYIGNEFVVTGTTPIISATLATGCIGYFTIQGFKFANSEGQTADLTYTHDLIFQYNEGMRTDVGSYGPGVIIGPGQHGPCVAAGVFSGPDNVTVQYNYIHQTWGECIYDGAETSDPPGYGNASFPGAEYTANGMTCTTNCPTGANHLIQYNTVESCASWGGQGDGTDVKDGHVNLQVIGNTYRTTLVCPMCYGAPITAASESSTTVTITSSLNPGTGTNNVKVENVTPSGYNGTFSVTSSNSTSFQYTTGSGLTAGTLFGTAIGPCTGFGSGSGSQTCGNDGQGPLFESGALVAGNYIEAPGHQCIPIYSSWNNSAGRGVMNIINNVCINANSGVGSNTAYHWWPPLLCQLGGAQCPSATITPVAWTGVNIYNNSAYLNGVANAAPCISIDSGGSGNGTNPASSANVENNICHTSNTGLAAAAGIINVHDYNDFYNSTCPGETHGICTNPLYVSTTPPYVDINFEVQTGSPAIGAGTPQSGLFTTDYFGNLRGTPWWDGFYQAPAGGAAPAAAAAILSMLRAQ